jgi:hypothetical protein
MLRALGLVFKLAIFSIIVLALGNKLHLGDRTISDQIQSQMAQAERSSIYNDAKNWTEDLLEDVKKGATRLRELQKQRRETPVRNENILPTERQKLRALIQELNSSKNAD